MGYNNKYRLAVINAAIKVLQRNPDAIERIGERLAALPQAIVNELHAFSEMFAEANGMREGGLA